MLSIQGKILLIQVATFVLGAGLIYLIYLKPLARFLKARKQGIAKDLDAAKEARSEAAKWKAELEAEQKRLAEEQRRELEKARAEAAELRQELFEKARQEQEALLLTSRRQLAHERAEALRQIRAEAAALVVQAAEKLLERHLDKTTQEALARKALASIKVSRN